MTSQLFQLKRSSVVVKLMLFGRHRQIDNRQNHENEGLQRNSNQDRGKWPTAHSESTMTTTATDQQSE